MPRLRRLLLDGKEQLELGGQLLLRVQPVGEVNAPDAAVRVDLYPQRLNVVRAVGASCKIGEVELDLVPALVQPHGHGANEGLHPCCRLQGEAIHNDTNTRGDNKR